jgi:hypothetical protein
MNAHPSNYILNALPPQFDEFRAKLNPVPLPVGMPLFDARMRLPSSRISSPRASRRSSQP